MHTIAEMKNFGAFIDPRLAIPYTALTAGGGGDNTRIDGIIIDRNKVGHPHCLSAGILVGFEAVLAEDETLAISLDVYDGSDSGLSDGALFGDVLATALVVATGPTGGGTVRGAVSINVNLSGAQQYYRARLTPNLSAGSVDTAKVYAIAAQGGAQTLPAN